MEETQLKGIGYLLERTTRMVKLNYSQAFKSGGFHITPEQWVLLESLYQQDGQTQNELANGSFKDAPTISRILNILEKRGYVERRKKEMDKRVRRIHLSEQGRMLVREMQPTVNQLRNQGWNRLTAADYDHFVRIIDTLFENYSSTKLEE